MLRMGMVSTKAVGATQVATSPAWRKSRDSRRSYGQALRLAEEIALAQVDAVVAQDRVDHAEVEVEIWLRHMQQVGQTLGLDHLVAGLDLDVAVFAAGEARLGDAAHEIQGLGDARLQFRDA